MVQHFDTIEERLDAMDRRFDAMDERFDVLEGRVDRGFHEIGKRLDVLDAAR
jgi:hypothetical protein